MTFQRLMIAVITSFLMGVSAHTLERPDIEFKIFQFPANMIPRIDGNIDDWDIVPEEIEENSPESPS